MPPKANRLPRPESSAQGVQGLHLTADLIGCQVHLSALEDAVELRQFCREAVEASRLQAVADLFHPFQSRGCGVTGVVLLAESHLAVHTWPELACVTLDIHVCNVSCDNTAKAQDLLQRLVQFFLPTTQQIHRIERGILAPKARAARRPLTSPSAKASSKTE